MSSRGARLSRRTGARFAVLQRAGDPRSFLWKQCRHSSRNWCGRITWRSWCWITGTWKAPTRQRAKPMVSRCAAGRDRVAMVVASRETSLTSVSSGNVSCASLATAPCMRRSHESRGAPLGRARHRGSACGAPRQSLRAVRSRFDDEKRRARSFSLSSRLLRDAPPRAAARSARKRLLVSAASRTRARCQKTRKHTLDVRYCALSTMSAGCSDSSRSPETYLCRYLALLARTTLEWSTR